MYVADPCSGYLVTRGGDLVAPIELPKPRPKRRRREPPPKLKRDWAREEIGLGVQRCPVRREAETHPGPRRNSARARVMTWLHANGWKQAEIGEIYGVTESRVCQILAAWRR